MEKTHEVGFGGPPGAAAFGGFGKGAAFRRAARDLCDVRRFRACDGAYSDRLRSDLFSVLSLTNTL